MSISLAAVLRAIIVSRAIPSRGMVRGRAVVVLLALALPLVAAGGPVGGVSAQALAHLLDEQVAWLAEQIADRVPKLPGVDFEPQAALQQRCFPDFPEPLGVRIKGAYDPGERRIYLDTALDLAERLDQSYLLHELVHHFQVHGVRFPAVDPYDESWPDSASGVRSDGAEPRSRGRLEGEAYRLQLRWLEHVGVVDPLEALGLDDRTLQIIERSSR